MGVVVVLESCMTYSKTVEVSPQVNSQVSSRDFAMLNTVQRMSVEGFKGIKAGNQEH